MSTQVDERVVAMKFDRKDFGKNVEQTMRELEELDKKLQLKDASKGFEEIEKAASKVSLSGLEKSAEAVEVKFSTMSIVAITAISKIVNSALDAGTKIVKNLSIDQVTAGFSKYEQKLTSVQTIMNTTGKTIEEVEAQMSKLMTYTDETSYSFTDMVANIGTFTSNRIDLDVATRSMMGIANAAGFAGVNAEKATHGMTGFSKAMAKGFMDRQSWSWIQTAGMAIPELKEQFIEAAVAAGTLIKAGNGVYKTLAGNTVSVADFESALKDGWLTTKAMNSALNKFGLYSEEVMKIMENEGVDARTAMKALDKVIEETGNEALAYSAKMFKAAQESRTFGDALSATRDAVSTGWMKTFDLIFGNLDEAKELWSQVGEVLYDIFAEPGNIRNEIIEEWRDNDSGGREAFFEAIGNIWKNLTGIAGALSSAIREIFPPITADTLVELTKKFKAFTESIQLSEEALYSLKVISKVLLVPLKVIFQLVRVGVSIFVSFVKIIFQLANALLYLFAVGNPIEDLFRKIFGVERYNRLSASIFVLKSNIVALFSAISKKVKDAFGETKPLNIFLKVLEKIAAALAPLANLVLDGIVWAFEQLAKVDFTFIERALSSIATLFRTVAVNAKDFFINLFNALKGMSFADIFNSMTNAVKKFISLFVGLGQKNELADGLDETSESGNTVIDVLKRLIGRIGDLMKQITPAKILIIGFGVALINLAYSITKTMDSIGGLTSSVSSLAKAITKRIAPVTNTFKTVAECIVMIAGALGALALVDQSNLKSAAIILASMIGLFTALVVAFVLMNKFLLKDDAVAGMASFSKMMIGLSLSIVALSASLILLNKVDLQGLVPKLLLLTGLIAALTAIVAVASKKTAELTKGTTIILSYAAAVFLIAKALTAIGNINTNSIVGSLGVVALIILLLQNIGRSMRKVTFSGAAGILLMCANLIVLVKTLQKLGTYDIGSIIDGLQMYFGLLGALLALALTARIAGDGTKKMSMTFLSMAAAIVIMSVAVKQIGQLDKSEVIKGTASVAALMAMMALIVQASKLSWEQSGQTKMQKGFLAMSLSILAMMLAVKYLGSIPTEQLIKGEIAVMALMGMFALVGAVGKKAEKSMGAILAMTLAIGTLTTAMMLLTLVKFEEAMVSATALSMVLIAFGIAIGQLSKFDKNTKVSVALVIKMGLIISALASAIGLLAGISNWQNILGAAASLTVVLVALTGAMFVLKNAKLDKSTSDIASAIAAVGALGALVTIITWALSKIDATNIFAQVGAFAAISLVIAALGAVAALLTKFPIDVSKVWGGIMGVTALLGGIALIVVALGTLNQGMDKLGFPMSTFAKEGLALVAAMAPMLPIIAIAGAIAAALTTMPIDFAASVSAIGAITVILGGIVAIVEILGAISKIPFVNELADSGLDLLAKIMAGLGKAIASFVTEFVGGSIKGIGSRIAEMVDEFGQIDPIAIEHFATVAHAMFEALSVMPTTGGIFEAFTGSVKFDKVAAGFKTLLDGIFGMSDTINSAGEINQDKLQNACAAARKVLELANDLPSEGGLLQGILGSPDLGSFGNNLVIFGNAIASYWNSISNMDDAAFKKIESSAAAGQFLSKLANTLPSSGGVLQEWFGEKNLSTFGNQLRQFGIGLTNYHAVTAGLDKAAIDHIKMTAKAGEALAEMNKKLPSTGGILGEWFFGSQSLESFASGMYSFARALIALSNEDIDLNQIQNAGIASQSLVDLYNSLDAIGGITSLWEGKKDFEAFGTQLAGFAGKLKEYSDITTTITWTSVDKSITSLENFLWLSNKLKNVDTTTMKNFGDAMIVMANTGITEFVMAFANSEGQFELVGKVVSNRVMDGLRSKEQDFKQFGEDISRIVAQGVNKNLELVRKAGEYIGITLLDAANKILDINSPSGKFARVSKFCILGLEKGFIENQNIANNAASNVAENFLQAMKDTLEIHSPSYRVRQEVARPILEAFPEEFDENNQAEQAAKAKGEAIMAAFKTAFSDSNEARELMELERELFELKLDPALTDEQKQKALNELDTEQQKKILETYVDDYKLAVQQYQTIVKEMGEESSYAKEAQKTMLQQEITLRKYATQLTEATNAQVQAEMESYQSTFQELIQFMDTDYVSNQVKNQLKSMAKEGTLIDGLGIDEQLDQLEKDIASGSYEKKYASIVSSIKQGIWKEMSADTVVGGKMTQAVTADDLVKDLLGGVSIDEYAMQDVAGDLADSFVNAYLEELKKKSSSTSTSSDISKALAGGGDDPYKLPEIDVGKYLEQAFKGDEDGSIFSGTGIMRTISDTVDNITGWLSNSGDWTTSAIDSGKNFVSGLIEGLTDKEQEEKVKRTSKHVGDITTAYLDDGLGNASPSKFARESGMYFVQGLANGLTDYSYISTNAAEELARKVVSALSGYTDATESIAPVLVSQSEYNLSPVITPTLDLTEVEKGVSQIDAMLSALEARAIAFSMNPTVEENQNRSVNPAKSGGTSITFNQYNSSPKALSETEIYRQTKNQLTALKERGSYK